ncbi:MAG: amidohydrolase family protein [Treponema sp.]|nr:amidohydrolase family protein [Treponema sp.]
MRARKAGKLILALGILMAALVAGCAATGKNSEGVLYVNATIYTVDNAFSTATVLAVKGDRIAYVGSDRAAAEAALRSGFRVVDLEGKTVIPGIIDAHIHFQYIGQNMARVDAFWQPKEVIVDRVREAVALAAPGEWILGWGWNHEIWPGRQFPTREDLDAVSPNNPVALTRTDGHSLWVNSAAIEAAGITSATPDPEGGEILKNPRGEPSGMLMGLAQGLVNSVVPIASDSQKRHYYQLAQDHILSYGMTSFWDAGVSFDDALLLRTMYQAGNLKVRANVALHNGTAESDAQYINAGYKAERGMYGNRLSIASVKAQIDGSLGSRTAFLFEEYEDRPGHFGNPRYTEDELYSVISRAHANGFQPGIHAIGDGGVNRTLNVYERVLNEQPKDDHRFRIEHYQIVLPEDIPRTVAMGVIPSMQPVHATSDMNMAEDRVGPVRILSSYAWCEVLEKGGIIAGGSDAPVELLNPYHGLFAAITRMDKFGAPEGGWYPQHLMSREDALRGFTIWAAHAQFDEKLIGSLEAGKLADFVVLDRDIMTVSPASLRETQALLTVLGGEVVYEREIESPTLTVFGETVDGIVVTNGIMYASAAAFAAELNKATVTTAANGSSARIIREGVDATFTVGSDTARVNNANVPLQAAVAPGVLVSVDDLAKIFGLNASYHPHSLTTNVTF